tara:strand:+ start:521 stop:1165 length:645 start_codon:yes stop_codon:yes gene_type:complete
MVFNKYIAISLIFYTTLTLSCGGKTAKEQPEDLINKKIFTEIILELQLIEAHLNEVRMDQSVIRDSASNFFQEVLEKHSVSFEDFNSTMNYFASQPEELQGIYDVVLESLSEMEVELVDVKVDQDAISPLGKKQIVDFISHLPIAQIFKEPSYSSKQTKDSLFKYIAVNISLFDSLPYNIESFQKSYIGLTFNYKRYLSFREEVRLMLNSTEKN